MRFLYSLILIIALPFVLLRWLWRSRYVKGYRQRLSERFGFIPAIPQQTKTIWLHAVSVGETIAATPLINALLQRYPQYELIITTTTPTASAQVTKDFHDKVKHYYLPYDMPSAVKRFLRRTHPTLAIIMETELWPNLLYYTHHNGISILLANARLSERSLQGYQRISKLTQQMLSQITCVAAQSKADGERFMQLGLDPTKLLMAGNIKFDLLLPSSLLQEGQALRAAWGARPTLIAASTHETEESIILDAFAQIRQQYADAFLILVPRHPDRFAKVARLCQSANYRIAKRSLKEIPTADTDILLGDTMGELRLLYAASDIAFVGGSFVTVGGHNLIEPAALHLPILSGNHLHNFVAISKLLTDANALIVVNDANHLATQILQLLADKTQRDAMGERAYQVSADNTGALERHLQWINKELKNEIHGNQPIWQQ
jgi:3-deoxy-D-manno-octulosonic-acid transferase